MPLNDLDLIDEVGDGSQAAFDQLIRRHENFVYRVAFSFAGDKDGALDIAQNVFIRVHKKLHTFNRRSTFRTWIARIAQNESLSWLSSQKRHSGHVDVTSVSGPAIKPVQEETMIQDQKSQILLAELHRLNPRQRQAVLLRYYENMSVREISDVLECSEDQVKNILFRSLRKLRNYLSGPDGWNQELEA